MPGVKPPDEGSEVADLLCFDLYAASRAMTALYRPVLGGLGLTYPQYLVLVVLWRRGACTIKHLSTTLRLDHGTLTPLLVRMEDAGLLTRERADADGRAVEVTLTHAGDAMRSHAAELQERVRANTGLSDDEITGLQRLLRTLTAALDASRDTHG